MRQTASDRPGVAQPVPVRDIPARPWGPILLATLVMTALLLGGWEMALARVSARRPVIATATAHGPSSAGASTHGEGGKTVLIGSSRVLFDVQLPVWERIAGERPIQLAMEGTSPRAGAGGPGRRSAISPGACWSAWRRTSSSRGFAYRGDVVPYYHQQGPSQRSGHWLSKHLLEPVFAFYDPRFRARHGGAPPGLAVASRAPEQHAACAS